VDTAGQVVFCSQGDVRTKVKTPGTGKTMVEEAVQTPTWRGCADSIISQSRVHAWSPTSPPTLFLKAPNAFLCLI
jgi:hypothetical protein